MAWLRPWRGLPDCVFGSGAAPSLILHRCTSPRPWLATGGVSVTPLPLPPASVCRRWARTLPDVRNRGNLAGAVPPLGPSCAPPLLRRPSKTGSFTEISASVRTDVPRVCATARLAFPPTLLDVFATNRTSPPCCLKYLAVPHHRTPSRCVSL